MNAERKRADILLLERGLAPSRARAQSLIAAGHVTSGARVLARASEMLAADAPLAVTGTDNPYVSRGGIKLAFALDHFAIAVDGLTALDIGASTGGFTDVLLRRGARRVYALDVGHGQLHASLAGNPRVRALEGTDARNLSASIIPEPPQIVTADVSFIGLSKALPAALALTAPGARLVALVKPQFEVGPALVGKKGIVRDEAARLQAVQGVADWLETQGWRNQGFARSPIAGGEGNVELLLAARRD